MVEWREVQVQTVGEPYGVKIEKNSKGFNYEISVKSDSPDKLLVDLEYLKKQVEAQLGGNVHEEQKACACV